MKGFVVCMAGLLLFLGAAGAAIDDSSGQSPSPAKRGGRPFRVDDTFRTEEFGAPLYSPDGLSLAFTLRRAATTQLTNGLLIPETRSDVWLQAKPGAEARNLTNGASDASGWWAPRWSPDGAYLSFLSTRGGQVTAWVWDRQSESIRQLGTTGIEFRGSSGGCRWAADAQLICLAVKDGEQSPPTTSAGAAIEYATAAWQRNGRGELARSAVDSLSFMPPARRLVCVNAARGSTHEIAAVPFDDDNWWLSPDGRTVAFARLEPSDQQRRTRLAMPAIELRRLDGTPLKLDAALPRNVALRTVSWSPDGRALAFFALGTAKLNPQLLYGEEFAHDVAAEPVSSRDYPGKLWQVDVGTGRVAQVDTGDIDLGQELQPPSFRWLASGELLFNSRRLSERAQPNRQSEPDWWVLARDGTTRRLLRDSKPALASLESFDGGRTFLSLSGGDLWRVDAQAGTASNVTHEFATPVQRYRVSEHGPESALLLSAGEPGDPLSQYWNRYAGTRYYVKGVSDYLLDLRTGAIAEAERPELTGVPVSFHGPSAARVYKVTDRAGTRLWRTGGPGASARQQLAAINLFERDLAVYTERILDFTTLEGGPAQAKVTFPLDYVPGRKYPLVVDFDIGYEPEGSRHLFTLTREDGYASDATARIYASAGYVYMFTSAPTRTILDHVGRGNMLLFTNGVLAAIDAAIDAGFVDRDRIVLYGASSAGFGALGVVTQTSRFKAAVAESLWSDQITNRLMRSQIERYSDTPFDWVGFSAQYSVFDLPFWRNGDHLRRNSPLSYVDRVRTPLMLIQHDFDFLPMSQAEMFFAGLVLQRKPARFVRYWGEEHGLRTPANERDKYQQVFAWYDEHADIARDGSGAMVFDGARVKSRSGQPPLRPEDFNRFGPAAPSPRQTTTRTQ